MSETDKSVRIGTIVKNSVDLVRVDLSEYHGKPLIDVRIYSAFRADGIARPTKKGVSLQVAQLPELIRLLVEAAALAEELGLMPDKSEGGAS